MTKVICYHHNDSDGRMAAAIVKQKYLYAEFKEVKYGMKWETKDVRDAIVYVVDFSFPDMEHLQSACKALVWVDHHESAKRNQPKSWESKEINGKREVGKCGALLTWELFNRTTKAPKSVHYVNDYDVWIHAIGPETHWFAERNCNWTVDDFVGLLDDNPSLEYVLQEGEILYKAKVIRCLKSIERGKESTFHSKTIVIDHCFFYNTTPFDASLTGQMILEKGYTIAIGYYVDGPLMTYSLRSKGGLDVSIIAEQFGGGGHKNAAGFKKPFTLIY